MKINPINGYMPQVQAQKKPCSKPVNYSTQPLNYDNVSFKASSFNTWVIRVPLDMAKTVANSLSTSTSGHRAPYMSAKFSRDIVKLITLGVAGYTAAKAAETRKFPKVLIGGDTRTASIESLPMIKYTLLKQGSDVLNIKDPVPTPLLAMAAQKYGVDLAVLMTASHNPWNDGGYNLVTKAGAIAPAEITQEVAKYIEEIAKKGNYTESNEPLGRLIEINPYEMYKKQLETEGLIDWENIKKSGLKVFYDGLQGTGVYVMPKLMKDYDIPFQEIKSSGQEGPNPIDINLRDLKNAVQADKSPLKIGLSNDGDADRFGIVDENGKFVNANDVILLVAYHLAKNKGKQGAIIRSQATSMQLDRLADLYKLDKYETPVGFKYIAEDIIRLREEGKDILVAGEESGGLTVYGHIPEKDGIIALSLIMDLIATEKKPFSEILKSVKEELGVSFAINNYSIKMTDDKSKNVMMAKVESLFNQALEGKTEFGKHTIDVEKTAQVRKNMEAYRKGGDGYKFILTDGSSVLVRKSGTEPLVKFYIEATGENTDAAYANSEALKEELNTILTA